jgi:UDP-3-O-[3-hydroxymyristoyl] glucosamine N-acyltransferase
MVLSAGAVAALLGGTVEGNPELKLTTVCPIEGGGEGALSFLANPKYTSFIYTTGAAAVIVAEDFRSEGSLPCTLIRVKDPYASFAILLEQYSRMKRPPAGIHPSASIDHTATVGVNAYIGAQAVIEAGASVAAGCFIHAQVFIGRNAKVGDNVTLHPGVRLLEDCVVGSNCIIHSGTVIGSDGFGFAPSDNAYGKVPQIGNVVIEDDVEIGANCTIDRATMGSTIIRKGVKLDNLIQIAHNVEVGEHTVIAAQAGVAGSTKIGKRCMIGGQVGIIGHITIGDNVKIAAQSGIGASIPDNAIVQGSPAFDVASYRRSYVSFRNLPAIGRELALLRREIETLKTNKG